MYQVVLFYRGFDCRVVLVFSSLKVAKKVALDSVFKRSYSHYELYGEEEGFIESDII